MSNKAVLNVLTKANEALESLDLSENKRMKLDAYMLITNKYLDNMYSNLTSLRLAGNHMGDEAGIIITTKLVYKTPLKVLDLS